MSAAVLYGAEGVLALTNSVGAVLMARDVIVAEGPDTLKFLQSQVSQDLGGLEIGMTTWTFLLQPTGKLVGFLRVTRIAADAYRLDADIGAGAGVESALRRFLIRTKCVISLTESSPMWAVRGPDALVHDAPEGSLPGLAALPGFDLFSDELLFDAPTVDPLCFEYVRISSGIPMWPYEFNESTIPNATGLVGLAVSFSKGCYVGQELVERIDSRGAMTPRVLRRVRFNEVADGAVEDFIPGAELSSGGAVRGVLTSACEEPARSGGGPTAVAAMAYVHRDIGPGSSVECAGFSGTVSALGEW